MKKGIQNTIKTVRMFKVICSYSLILLAVYCAACSKSGEAIEQERFTLLTLNAITVDSLRLSVIDNGVLLTDSLMTPQGKVEMNRKYQDPARGYKVTDLYSNTVLFDSTINYQNLFNNSVTFFQPVSGGKLIQVRPPANAPLPHKDSIKISVVYSHPSTDAIYDQVKVVVDQSKDGGPTYVSRDSFLLKRGEFSPFFAGTKLRNPVFKFYTNDARRAQVSIAVNGTFSLAGDISIYYLNLKNDASASGAKLY